VLSAFRRHATWLCSLYFETGSIYAKKGIFMQIEIWSDVICPWCYIGKRRFEAALAQFPQRKDFNIVWRSFELDPGAPQQQPGTLEQMLSRKYRVSLEQAAAMNARVTALAREVGLEYRLSEARPGNTFDAHRLLHFAAARQIGEQAAERIMKAYFSEGLPVGDRSALAQLAPEFGISETDAQSLLEGNGYADAVRADEARADGLGITGVPFFVLDGKIGVSGAQPVETFVEALQRSSS
jgi:predicted DsbA family dithiol-disulfide isomerase